MLWTAYLNGGSVPRGADFVRAVRELAERTGVDPSPLERSQPHNRRADLLHDFFGFCRFELIGEEGSEARRYLERRGFPDEAIADSGLGVVPAPAKTRSLLERAGYRQEEIAKADVLADSPWPGRLCGAWRDSYGRIGTLWARSLDNPAAAERRRSDELAALRSRGPP
jgi:DNA primase